MCGQHSWVIAQCWWAGVWQDIERPTLTPTHPAEITWWWALPVFTVSLTIIWHPARPSDLISTQQNTSPLPPHTATVKTPGCMGSPSQNKLYYWSFALHSYRQHCATITLVRGSTLMETNWISRVKLIISHLVTVAKYPNYTHTTRPLSRSLSPSVRTIETCNSPGPATCKVSLQTRCM